MDSAAPGPARTSRHNPDADGLTLALEPDVERTCVLTPTGTGGPIPLRWKLFTDLWIAERRRQLEAGVES